MPYHADGEPCILYTADDILALAAAKERHILYHTTYHNQLKEYLKTPKGGDEAESVYYSMELPEPYRGNLWGIVGMFAGGNI